MLGRGLSDDLQGCSFLFTLRVIGTRDKRKYVVHHHTGEVNNPKQTYNAERVAKKKMAKNCTGHAERNGSRAKTSMRASMKLLLMPRY